MSNEFATSYVNALFNLTSSNDMQKRWLADLEALVTALQNPKIKLFFSAPKVTVKEKIHLLEKTLKNSVDKLLLSFLCVLLERNRFKYLSEITHKFRELLDEKHGILDVRLITAVPIDEDLKESLKEKLEKIYGKKIEIEQETDTQLIGGGILIIADKMIDFSIKGKLKRLQKALL